MRTVVAMMSLSLAAVAAAKPPAPKSVGEALDGELSWLERDLVPAVEAMPEDKFNFVPTAGDFKGVRSFAQEVKHIAHTNIGFFASLLGEKPPASFVPDETNGPATMTSKSDIVRYLKESFALGHRAMRAMTAATVMETTSGGWVRLDAANLTVWHSYDHYGQIVEYLRMNGIVPPATVRNK